MSRDRPQHIPSRLERVNPRFRSPLTIALLALLLLPAACGPTGPTSSASAQPSEQPPPGSSGPSASQAPPPGQTDTAWGRIWDELPAGFPIYPGSTLAGDASAEAVSARYAFVGGDPAEIASWMQAELANAGYSTEALSGPFEDGSHVLDVVGDGECRIQTTIAPLGRLTFLSVLYGAACPPG
jgi:hypothetical protein